MRVAQPDLFAQKPGQSKPAHNESPAFVESVRQESLASLAVVQAATALPWPDLTGFLLAERRFWSLLHWLPEEEGASLRRDCDAHMDRIWDLVHSG